MVKHIEIRQAGRSIAVQQGVTILEAALADGIAYPHGCRSGRCGSCKSRLVSGEVDLLDHRQCPVSGNRSPVSIDLLYAFGKNAFLTNFSEASR